MADRFETYVADPAEPAPRPALDRWRATLWTLLVVLLIVSLSSLYLEGRGEEDPALQAPAGETAP